MAKKIKIKNVEYAVKPGMRSMIVFEKMRDKAFEIKTMTDLLSYIYCSIICGTPDKPLEFEDMIEAFDEDQQLFKDATAMVLQRNSLEDVVRMSNEGGPEPKKE